MNTLDRLISAVAPGWAVRRERARRILAYYEAANPSRYLKKRRESGSADTATGRAGRSLREQARHLDQNHDLAIGVLNILVANIAGPFGIGIEPQPRRRDGSIHEDLSRRIRDLQRDWEKRPEVTWCHDWASVQRLAALSWVRDGEVLAHLVQGRLSGYRHGTQVPLSLEMLEADYLPLDYNDSARRIVQGVEKDRWGRPLRYHCYTAHPGDAMSALLATSSEMIQIPAARMLHLGLTRRFHQTRGVSVFAAVLERLEDLKDYEESERVAAKVAASMAAYIRKGTPDQFDSSQYGLDATGRPAPRDMRFRAGMIFDDLLPGEDVGTINTSRPNPQMEPHRKGQLRAVAGGTYCTYSSAAKDYDGSYSAQRQEMVEGWGVYGILQSEFIGQLVRPVHERFIDMALASGQIVLPGDVDPMTLDDALFIAPQQPWIDPDKESRAYERLEQNIHASGPEIIRRRGQNPRDVIEQQVAWERDRARVLAVRSTEPDPVAQARERRNLTTDMSKA